MLAIHAWTMSLPATDDGTLGRMGEMLDDGETARAARFMRAANREEFVTAHGLKRVMLGQLLGTDPRALRFCVSPDGGKPELALPGRQDLRFNLSHSNGMVACAAAFGAELGIDVEPRGRRVEPSVADHFFAPDEARWLAERPETKRDEDFMALWTLKEALVKASGLGLSQGLETFSMRPDPPRLLRHIGVVPSGHSGVFSQWNPTPGHVAALAVILPEGEEVDLSFRHASTFGALWEPS